MELFGQALNKMSMGLDFLS